MKTIVQEAQVHSQSLQGNTSALAMVTDHFFFALWR
jgi:hypothetical protein